ncbi:rod shape-determining protein MreC [Candidatus Pelagibacter sp.]|uniref:rod shape-determining protein MreC n=1 Tax=Candidatus Pelagibacter sp. TaxID=2024849 RepID=UPI003F8682CC
MATGRDDFVIAIRSAFLKKKDKQKFSLLTLIFVSIFVIVLSDLNFKAIKFVKLGVNEVIYRSSHIVSIPENKLKEITSKFKSHMELYESNRKEFIKIKNSDQLKLQNEFLTAENKKLRKLLDESINSQEIFARVLIDKDSPYLKSVVLNKGTKDKVKIGMAVIDEVYLVGQIIEVNYSNSRALLLSDLNSKIPSVLEPDDIQAVVSGTGSNFGTVEHTQIDYKESLNNKEIIAYTSGLGGLFKPGIPIGKIDNNSDGQINFFSDFTQLNYVKIVSYNFGGKK